LCPRCRGRVVITFNHFLSRSHYAVYDNVAPPISQNPAPVATELPTLKNDTSDAIVPLIEKLSKLRDAGALTDGEFNMKKIELLNRL
jgi:hypothetical protein